MKNIKTIILLGIPYFTVCSGLYHIAYWDTFNINGLAYISLPDLIKSFVYPCIYFLFIAVLSFIIGEGIFHVNKVFPHGEGRNTAIGKKVNSIVGRSLSLILWLSLVITMYTYGNVYRWYYWSLIVGIVPMLVLDNLGFWLTEFTDNRIRIHAIRILVFLPIISFASGKYQSELIYKNIKYQYVTNDSIYPNYDSSKIDTLKYLGNTDKYFILANLKNSAIIFIRNDKLEIMSLRQNK